MGLIDYDRGSKRSSFDSRNTSQLACLLTQRMICTLLLSVLMISVSEEMA